MTKLPLDKERESLVRFCHCHFVRKRVTRYKCNDIYRGKFAPEMLKEKHGLGGNMGYSEKVQEKITALKQRAAERRALWQGITEPFDNEGADGVANMLTKQIADIQKGFNNMLSKLESML
jgi:hypothetical protein